MDERLIRDVGGEKMEYNKRKGEGREREENFK